MAETWTSRIDSLEYGLCISCGKMIPIDIRFCYECEFGSEVKPITIAHRKNTPGEINKAIDILKRRDREDGIPRKTKRNGRNAGSH